jgi:hypothetical protein
MKKSFLIPILTLLFLFVATMASAQWVTTQLTNNTKVENVRHIPAILSLLLFSSQHTISGNVFGDVQAGVTITLSGDSSATTTTGAEGGYGFPGLENGSYTVTPSLSGYSFTPTSENVTVSGADETGVDFTAVEIIYTYSINGTVDGDVLAGVTITLSGDSSATTTTGAEGGYGFSGLENGSYTVTPSLSGYSFTPTSENVTVSGADETGVDFTTVEIMYTYSINGTVGGDVLAGVTMTLSGDGAGTTTTGSDGSYSFTGLSNGSYMVTPSKSGYTFSPTNASLTISDDDETDVDFNATISECAPECENGWIGDGECDYVCDVAACSYDGGDCFPSCARGCPEDWVGDGWCDDECNVAACSYDDGDC